MNLSVSVHKKEASPRSKEELRLDIMSSSSEVSSHPTNCLSVGWCCGVPLSQLEALAELYNFWGCVSPKGQVSRAWQHLRAFARNEPFFKGKVVELEEGKKDLFKCCRPSNYTKHLNSLT